jgi:hypothetical protein
MDKHDDAGMLAVVFLLTAFFVWRTKSARSRGVAEIISIGLDS